MVPAIHVTETDDITTVIQASAKYPSPKSTLFKSDSTRADPCPADPCPADPCPADPCPADPCPADPYSDFSYCK